MADLKFSRDLFDSEEWEDAARFRIFFFLIGKAKQRATSYRGVPVLRGQVVAGRDFIAGGTGLTSQVVRTRMKRMREDKTIDWVVYDRDGKPFTVITVTNYIRHQKAEQVTKAPTPYLAAKKKLMKNQYSKDFDRWWLSYKKGVKAPAWAEWQELLSAGELPDIKLLMAATRAYLDYCGSSDRPLLDAERFLKRKTWESTWTHKAQGTKAVVSMESAKIESEEKDKRKAAERKAARAKEVAIKDRATEFDSVVAEFRAKVNTLSTDREITDAWHQLSELLIDAGADSDVVDVLAGEGGVIRYRRRKELGLLPNKGDYCND